MAIVEEIHLNDIGTIFRMTLLDGTTPVNISNATTKQLIFKKPSSVVVTQTAVFYTDGSDGIIQYTIVDGDLSETGEWQKLYISRNGCCDNYSVCLQCYPAPKPWSSASGAQPDVSDTDGTNFRSDNSR